MPFDIPDNWTLFKLETFTYSVGNKNNQIMSKEVKLEGKYPVVSQGQALIDGYCNEDRKVIEVNPTEPLIMFGDHTRNIKIIDFSFVIGADGTKFFRPILINEQYLYFLLSYVATTLRNRGYARHFSLLKQEYLPLPPLVEQQRIVDKINSFEPLLEKYDSLEKKLSALEAEFPEKLKKSILQYAIEGKLVKQDPNDEPASVLLERIKAEKEQLIKEGKIKRDKNESYIYQGDDKNYYEKIGETNNIIDVSFDVSDRFLWTRLSTVCTKIVDGDHNPPKGQSIKTNYLMLSSQNINDDSVVNLELARFLTKEQFEIENLRTNIQDNDILFTSVGTLGRTCVFHGSLNICFQRSVSIIHTLLNPDYLKMYFDSPTYQNMIFREATGTAQKGFYLNQLSSSLISFPSSKEQTRIVAKYNLLLNVFQ